MSKVIGCPNCGSKELYGKVILNPVVPINANWGHETLEQNGIKKAHRFIKINVALCRVKIRALNLKELLNTAITSETVLACPNCKQEFSGADFENLTREKERIQAKKKAEVKTTEVKA